MQEEQLPDYAIKLLHSFPLSRYAGPINTYKTGLSGVYVLAVQFVAENPKHGLDKTCIVKFGSEDWAHAQEAFYQHLRDQELLEEFPFLAPLQMVSTRAVDGYMAVAYELAFDSVIDTKMLAELLEAHEDEAQEQITRLTPQLHKWYRHPAIRKKSVTEKPFALLRQMLTEKRVNDLLPRITAALPWWQADNPLITIDIYDHSPLPNPLVYLKEETWVSRLKDYAAYPPRAHIHEDLHTKNIICDRKSKSVPKIIDFDQTMNNGVPFFDLAYLEFDLMRQLFPVERAEDRERWITLLDFSMSDMLPGEQPLPSRIANAWRFIQPLRQEVIALRDATKSKDGAEFAWWLSTVAVGLNFARKQDPDPLKHIAGLIYAAYGLNRILRRFHVDEKVETSAMVIPWIRGRMPRTTSSEMVSPPGQEAADKASPPATTSEKMLPEPGTGPVYETPEQPLPVEKTVTVLSPVKETAENKAEDPDERAREIQTQLQRSIDSFKAGGSISSDIRRSTHLALQQLETLLQDLKPQVASRPLLLRSGLEHILRLQQEVLVRWRSFQSVYPLNKPKTFLQQNYPVDCSMLSQELQELLEKFMKFLQDFRQQQTP